MGNQIQLNNLTRTKYKEKYNISQEKVLYKRSLSMDSFSKIPKKKRFSQHRPNSLNYKISYSIKKNQFSLNDKSLSLPKNKKIRLHTDYNDYDHSPYHSNHANSFGNLKPSVNKKSSLGHSNPIKRKDSLTKYQNHQQFKLTKNYDFRQFVVNSTKFDSKKNNELKALFSNPYESKIKNYKKAKQNNHNGSVYINLKQKKPSAIINSINSPYNQHIHGFSKQNQKHTRSRQQNQSMSREKREFTLKEKEHRKSTGQGPKISATPKNIDLSLIGKNNIKIKTIVSAQEQKTYKQENHRKSTINNDSKINNFFKNPVQHKNASKRDNSSENDANSPPRQDQQATVKTIKKQQTQFNPKKSSLKQLESSRVTSEASESSDDYGLTDEEIETFGDRFPYGFQKIKLLGRGGFSLVWLGKHVKSGKQFAIKQIISNNTHQTHIKEIWFGTMFFTLGGVPKPEFSTYPGIKNLVRLYSYEINQTDTWIFYEKCGKSLGTSLYDIKSEKIFGEQKLYKIHYKPFYQAIARNPSILSQIVIEICKSLALLSQCEIVHSDLKTENILIKFNEDEDFQMTELKLIDYGSSFEFRNISQFSMATPEYMPPEILNYIIHQNEGEYEQELYDQVMKNYQNPWAVDIWSLGCVLLQIVVGVPLWMSLPLLVPNRVGKSYLQKQGLFAVMGRLFPQIISKQREVVSRLQSVLEKQNYSRIVISTGMRRVITGMLSIDFNKRISPSEVIEILSKEEWQSST